MRRVSLRRRGGCWHPCAPRLFTGVVVVGVEVRGAFDLWLFLCRGRGRLISVNGVQCAVEEVKLLTYVRGRSPSTYDSRYVGGGVRDVGGVVGGLGGGLNLSGIVGVRVLFDFNLNLGRALHSERFRDKDRLILIRNFSRLEVLGEVNGVDVVGSAEGDGGGRRRWAAAGWDVVEVRSGGHRRERGYAIGGGGFAGGSIDDEHSDLRRVRRVGF